VRRDLYAALVFVALGVGVVAESLRMPRFEHLGVNPYTVPGIVPGVLGAVIALLGAVMLTRTVARLRLGSEAQALAPESEPGSASRLALTLLLTLGYATILVGWLPFALATFLFVLAFLVVFEWRPGRSRGQWLTHASTALLQAVLVAWAVTFVFERIFLVRLP
jgi:hypothetical protein